MWKFRYRHFNISIFGECCYFGNCPTGAPSLPARGGGGGVLGWEGVEYLGSRVGYYVLGIQAQGVQIQGIQIQGIQIQDIQIQGIQNQGIHSCFIFNFGFK